MYAGCLGRIEIFWLIGIHCPGTKGDRTAVDIQNRKHYPPAKAIENAFFFFVYRDEAGLFDKLLVSSKISKNIEQTIPFIGRKADVKLLLNLLGDARAFEILSGGLCLCVLLLQFRFPIFESDLV